MSDAKVPATTIRGSALNAAGSTASEPVIPRLQFLNPPLVRVEGAQNNNVLQQLLVAYTDYCIGRVRSTNTSVI